MWSYFLSELRTPSHLSLLLCCRLVFLRLWHKKVKKKKRNKIANGRVNNVHYLCFEMCRFIFVISNRIVLSLSSELLTHKVAIAHDHKKNFDAKRGIRERNFCYFLDKTTSPTFSITVHTQIDSPKIVPFQIFWWINCAQQICCSMWSRVEPKLKK